MKRHGNRKRSITGLIVAAALIVLLLIAAYQGGRWLEMRNARPEVRGVLPQIEEPEVLIEQEDATYARRKNQTLVLLMGIDQSGADEGAGRADFMRLIVLDHERQFVQHLRIDCNAMTPIAIPGESEGGSEVRTAQLGLAYGFGDGGEQSCALTEEAVSKLLFGVPIDFYFAIDLDVIPVINDMVGGVEVTLKDDFSAFDPAMTPGATLTLTGEQAGYYIRSDLGDSAARTARQGQYFARLIDQLNQRQQSDRNFMAEFYEVMGNWMTTDLGIGQLINDVLAVRSYERLPVIVPEGVYQTGADGSVEFYADADALKAIVTELFYEAVPSAPEAASESTGEGR